MSKKKRFGISPTLSTGFQETVGIVENDTGLLRNVVIPLQRIETDPDNPRKLAISLQDISQGLNKDDIAFQQKEIELKKLKEVADTIKSNGILQPIIVYKFGEKYRIVAGERRFLSATIAGLTHIDARVYDQKPQEFDLRLIQWIENNAREDLSLHERMDNIRSIINEYKVQTSVTEVTATWLSETIGLSLPQASYYMLILNAEPDVQEAIKNGYINNLDKAAVISGIHKNDLRKIAIEACKNGMSLKELRQIIREEKNVLSNRKKQLKTLSKKALNIGQFTRPDIIKFLTNAILSTPECETLKLDFADVKWEDIYEATKAFKKLVSLLEKHLEKI